MSKHENNQPPAGDTATGQPRKTYTRPELLPCGDVRDVTMGGSPGVGDSGNGALERPFGT